MASSDPSGAPPSDDGQLTVDATLDTLSALADIDKQRDSEVGRADNKSKKKSNKYAPYAPPKPGQQAGVMRTVVNATNANNNKFVPPPSRRRGGLWLFSKISQWLWGPTPEPEPAPPSPVSEQGDSSSAESMQVDSRPAAAQPTGICYQNGQLVQPNSLSGDIGIVCATRDFIMQRCDKGNLSVNDASDLVRFIDRQVESKLGTVPPVVHRSHATGSDSSPFTFAGSGSGFQSGERMVDLSTAITNTNTSTPVRKRTVPFPESGRSLTKNPNGTYVYGGAGSSRRSLSAQPSRSKNRFRSPAFGATNYTSEKTAMGSSPVTVFRMNGAANGDGPQPSKSTDGGIGVSSSHRSPGPALSPTRAALATANAPPSPSPVGPNSSLLPTGSTSFRLSSNQTAVFPSDTMRRGGFSFGGMTDLQPRDPVSFARSSSTAPNRPGSSSATHASTSSHTPTRVAVFMNELIKDSEPELNRRDIVNPYQRYINAPSRTGAVDKSNGKRQRLPTPTSTRSLPMTEVQKMAKGSKKRTASKMLEDEAQASGSRARVNDILKSKSLSAMDVITATVPEGSKRSRPPPSMMMMMTTPPGTVKAIEAPKNHAKAPEMIDLVSDDDESSPSKKARTESDAPPRIHYRGISDRRHEKPTLFFDYDGKPMVPGYWKYGEDDKKDEGTADKEQGVINREESKSNSSIPSGFNGPTSVSKSGDAGASSVTTASVSSNTCTPFIFGSSSSTTTPFTFAVSNLGGANRSNLKFSASGPGASSGTLKFTGYIPPSASSSSSAFESTNLDSSSTTNVISGASSSAFLITPSVTPGTLNGVSSSRSRVQVPSRPTFDFTCKTGTRLSLQEPSSPKKVAPITFAPKNPSKLREVYKAPSASSSPSSTPNASPAVNHGTSTVFVPAPALVSSPFASTNRTAPSDFISSSPAPAGNFSITSARTVALAVPVNELPTFHLSSPHSLTAMSPPSAPSGNGAVDAVNSQREVRQHQIKDNVAHMPLADLSSFELTYSPISDVGLSATQLPADSSATSIGIAATSTSVSEPPPARVAPTGFNWAAAGMAPPKPSDQWTCPVCSLSNPASATKCQVCEADRQ
ncbi:hypothetical protein FISHEDRAFT_55639 [Fistulina hepatica ATCC 64428]|uniref:RanBP2-type domain-containing protein n=1 Tax=Fistulina hepatica ATCC 64428 TaxID=1128425 RepID=A0A0D7AN37_9AGAR|nr:hypothetical protein FISHEDRAFT_55639 [Fistulina hepatica ATCC 64428]